VIGVLGVDASVGRKGGRGSCRKAGDGDSKGAQKVEGPEVRMGTRSDPVRILGQELNIGEAREKECWVRGKGAVREWGAERGP